MYEPGQSVQSSGGVTLGSPRELSSPDRQPYGDQAISNITQLPFLEAFVDATGEAVTILAACNWAGHSPADIVVNRRGKQSIGTFEELTVIDPRAVPNPQLSELRNRQAQIQQQRGYSQQTAVTR